MHWTCPSLSNVPRGLLYAATEHIELLRGETALLPPPQAEPAGMEEPLYSLQPGSLHGAEGGGARKPTYYSEHPSTPLPHDLGEMVSSLGQRGKPGSQALSLKPNI